MGEIEILQGNGADVPGVGHPDRIGVALAVRPGLGAVAGLCRYRFCKDVLLVKEHFQIPLHLVQGEHPLMERDRMDQQHIGVMLDLIQVKVILVIVVGAFIGIQILLQLRLHLAVGGLGPGQVRVLRKIGGANQAGGAAPNMEVQDCIRP